MSRLYFRSWGAAEVYLDGQKLSDYGRFSSDAATEKNFIPRYVLDQKIQVTHTDFHVLAVRFANHQAKKNAVLLKHNAPSLGFVIGFANEKKGAESERNYAYAIAALFSSMEQEVTNRTFELNYDVSNGTAVSLYFKKVKTSWNTEGVYLKH